MKQLNQTTYSYFDFLKMHLIAAGIPLLLTGLSFIPLIMDIVHDAQKIYLALIGDSSAEPITVWWVLQTVARHLLIAFAISLVARLFTTGLHFLPYFAEQNDLRLGRVVRFGFSKFFGVLFITVATGILVSGVGAVLSLIPLLGFIVVPVMLYINALLRILYDYAFSVNAMNGQMLIESPADHCRDLFVKHKAFLLYGLLLMLSYFVLIGSFFVRPFIQLKLAAVIAEQRTPHAGQASIGIRPTIQA